MRILAVAINTFREAVRDKILYVLLLFAAATILGSKALGWITIGQDIKVVKDISLASISVFGALIAIFVGTSLVYKEIDKRTIYTILSRPLWRFEFILGKFLGLSMVLAVVTLIMTAMAASYVVVIGGSVGLVFFQSVLLIYWKLLIVTALSVLLSSLASPILGALVVFSAYVFGHATSILIDLPPQLQDTWAEKILLLMYYVFPNFSHFDITSEAANGEPVAAAYILWAVVYGTAYTAMLLIFATLAFENKDV